MNINLALQNEQEQRIENDLVAVKMLIDKETDLYYQGQADAAFKVDPVHPESDAYWYGYCEIKRKECIRANNPMPQNIDGMANQGSLYATARAISKQYGKLSIIGTNKNYQGWEIETSGLKIKIATMDWTEAESETKWTIYSSHSDALVYLVEIFGVGCHQRYDY